MDIILAGKFFRFHHACSPVQDDYTKAMALIYNNSNSQGSVNARLTTFRENSLRPVYLEAQRKQCPKYRESVVTIYLSKVTLEVL